MPPTQLGCMCPTSASQFARTAIFSYIHTDKCARLRHDAGHGHVYLLAPVDSSDRPGCHDHPLLEDTAQGGNSGALGACIHYSLRGACAVMGARIQTMAGR